MQPITPETAALIDRALAEDVQGGDVTTEALIPADLMGKARLIAEEDGVLSGLDTALAVFQRVDSGVETHADLAEGAGLEPGMVVGSVSGPVASILTAERTALNFVRRLSGIATETSRYVREVAGYDVKILDTRKTTPGLRNLEKQAVAAGGGANHRRGLGDGVLIKDNHIEALRSRGWPRRDRREGAGQRAPLAQGRGGDRGPERRGGGYRGGGGHPAARQYVGRGHVGGREARREAGHSSRRRGACRS